MTHFAVLLNHIPLCIYVIVCLSILLLVDVFVVSTWGLLQIILLGIFLYMYFSGCIHSSLLGIILGKVFGVLEHLCPAMVIRDCHGVY